MPIPSLESILGILGGLAGGAFVAWLLGRFGANQRAKGSAAASEEFEKRVTAWRSSLLKALEGQKGQIKARENDRIRRGMTSDEVDALIRGRNDDDS